MEEQELNDRQRTCNSTKYWGCQWVAAIIRNYHNPMIMTRDTSLVAFLNKRACVPPLSGTSVPKVIRKEILWRIALYATEAASVY